MSINAGLSQLNQAAQLAGLFNWQLNDAKFTNSSGLTVSFYVIDPLQVPAEQYINGALNVYNLVSNTLGISGADPNIGLFNTSLSTQRIHEDILRKHAYNRVPYANYDQPVDLGTGGQSITMYVMFTGQMYQTAFANIIQALFNNNKPGLGTLLHPIYGTINNVLPVRLSNSYEYSKLNCVVCEITFLTTDLKHLLPNNISKNIINTLSEYYIATQEAYGQIGGIKSAIQGANTDIIKSLTSNL